MIVGVGNEQVPGAIEGQSGGQVQWDLQCRRHVRAHPRYGDDDAGAGAARHALDGGAVLARAYHADLVVGGIGNVQVACPVQSYAGRLVQVAPRGLAAVLRRAGLGDNAGDVNQIARRQHVQPALAYAGKVCRSQHIAVAVQQHHGADAQSGIGWRKGNRLSAGRGG